MIDWLFRRLFFARLPYLLQIPIKTRGLQLENMEIGWVPTLSFCLYRHGGGGGWILHVGFVQMWLHQRELR